MLSPEYEEHVRLTTDRFVVEGLTLERALRWLSAECGEAQEALLLVDKVIPRKRHMERTNRDVAEELADVVGLALIGMILAGEDPVEVLQSGMLKHQARWKTFYEAGPGGA